MAVTALVEPAHSMDNAGHIVGGNAAPPGDAPLVPTADAVPQAAGVNSQNTAGGNCAGHLAAAGLPPPNLLELLQQVLANQETLGTCTSNMEN